MAEQVIPSCHQQLYVGPLQHRAVENGICWCTLAADTTRMLFHLKELGRWYLLLGYWAHWACWNSSQGRVVGRWVQLLAQMPQHTAVLSKFPLILLINACQFVVRPLINIQRLGIIVFVNFDLLIFPRERFHWVTHNIIPELPPTIKLYNQVAELQQGKDQILIQDIIFSLI